MVQISQLAFEFDQRMISARNVTGAARTCAHACCGFHHRTGNLWMLRHRKVIVRAPHNHFALTMRRMPDSIGKAPNHSLEIGEHSIAPLLVKFILTVVALVSLAGSVMAQQPSSGLQNRTIKTLSTEQIAAIELADQLHLTTDQVGRLRTFFEAMKAETIPLGAI